MFNNIKKFIINFLNWAQLLLYPTQWSVFYRRLFIILFPITIPIWLIYSGIFTIIAIFSLVLFLFLIFPLQYIIFVINHMWVDQGEKMDIYKHIIEKEK